MRRWFSNVMRGNTGRAWIALGWALIWAALPAHAQLTGQRPVPLPQTESSSTSSTATTPTSSTLRSSTPTVLPIEEAFQLTAIFEGSTTLLLSWTIAPNHYLYRDKFQFLDASGRALPVEMPPAQAMTDEYFGETS